MRNYRSGIANCCSSNSLQEPKYWRRIIPGKVRLYNRGLKNLRGSRSWYKKDDYLVFDKKISDRCYRGATGTSNDLDSAGTKHHANSSRCLHHIPPEPLWEQNWWVHGHVQWCDRTVPELLSLPLYKYAPWSRDQVLCRLDLYHYNFIDGDCQSGDCHTGHSRGNRWGSEKKNSRAA